MQRCCKDCMYILDIEFFASYKNKNGDIRNRWICKNCNRMDRKKRNAKYHKNNYQPIPRKRKVTDEQKINPV